MLLLRQQAQKFSDVQALAPKTVCTQSTLTSAIGFEKADASRHGEHIALRVGLRSDTAGLWVTAHDHDGGISVERNECVILPCHPQPPAHVSGLRQPAAT